MVKIAILVVVFATSALAECGEPEAYKTKDYMPQMTVTPNYPGRLPSFEAKLRRGERRKMPNCDGRGGVGFSPTGRPSDLHAYDANTGLPLRQWDRGYGYGWEDASGHDVARFDGSTRTWRAYRRVTVAAWCEG